MAKCCTEECVRAQSATCIFPHDPPVNKKRARTTYFQSEWAPEIKRNRVDVAAERAGEFWLRLTCALDAIQLQSL